MAFTPRELPVIIRARSDRSRPCFKDSFSPLKYVAVEDLLPHRESGAPPRHEAAAEPARDSGPGLSQPSHPSGYKLRSFEVRDSFRADEVCDENGQLVTVVLPGKEVWEVRDRDTLEATYPKQRGAILLSVPDHAPEGRAEKRMVVLRFKGDDFTRLLRSSSKTPTEGEKGRHSDLPATPTDAKVLALLEALAERARIRLNVLVDGRLLVPLTVSPMLTLDE